MREVLKGFQEENPKSAYVQSFVIDKDYTEWRVLEELFPFATVLLCQFHTLKYLRFEFSRKKYNIGMVTRKSLESCVHTIVYASTAEYFETAWESFQTEWKCFLRSSTNPRADITNYFTKNWISCKSM